MVLEPPLANGHAVAPILDAASPAVDQLLAFSVPARDARGRVARLGPTLATILSRHAYPPRLARLLSEALVLTALLGAMLREGDGQLTLQAQAKGAVVDLLVCDWRGGKLRGYLRHDAERLARLGRNPSVKALFGRGYLAITLDQAGSAERYQGIVPLEGDSLAEMAERYFDQSEQLPTRVRIAAEGEVAGGIIVQHLPSGELGGPRLHVAAEHPDWSHVRALAETASDAELVDAALPLDEIVWRLFHEDAPRVVAPLAIAQGCRCSEAHVRSVLAMFSEADLAEMREADGRVKVDCAFCAQSFAVET